MVEGNTESDPRMGTIEHAIFVERSTNPNCPIVGDLIKELLEIGDVGMAYEIALDTLKPRKPFLADLNEHVSKLSTKLGLGKHKIP